VTPMAYCRYGCPTGALMKMLRYRGEDDRWGWREWLALGLVASCGVARWLS
jgi:NosR/NirI family transcriptional regulator, nitrous oxide reductase regulator